MDSEKKTIELINSKYDELSKSVKDSLVNVSYKLISRDDLDLWKKIAPLSVVTGEDISEGSDPDEYLINYELKTTETLENFNYIRVVTTQVATKKQGKLDLNRLEQDLKIYNESLNTFAFDDPAYTVSITILGLSDQHATKITKPATFEATVRRLMAGKLNIVTFLTVNAERPKVVSNILDEKVKLLMLFVNKPYVRLHSPIIPKDYFQILNPVLKNSLKVIHELNLTNGIMESIEE